MLSSLKGESTRATFFTVKQYSVACVWLNVPTAAMIVWGRRMHDRYNNNSQKWPLQIEQLEKEYVEGLMFSFVSSPSLAQAHSQQARHLTL